MNQNRRLGRTKKAPAGNLSAIPAREFPQIVDTPVRENPTLRRVRIKSIELLAALDTGTLVVLTLPDLGQHSGLGAAALETLQGAFQRLVFSHTDFRHLYFPPSARGGGFPLT